VIYKIRFEQGKRVTDAITNVREDARARIRAQLERDALTVVTVWADRRRLTDSELRELIGQPRS
jgi:hypothetical protein